MSDLSQKKAQEFLKTAYLYTLGELETEARHPLTLNLSNLAKENLDKAIESLSEVDLLALTKVSKKSEEIILLREDIQETLRAQGRIFLCGCGATGRLSLSLEKLWREMVPGSSEVVSFMAGGDVALVHSLESFEDYPDYGGRQLEELGFNENDLLICMSEGGETPFVLGALNKGKSLSRRKPWFVYCNPDALLNRVAERSKNVIADAGIKKLNLSVGPMALSGSTRMQASTVIQWAVGAALLLKDKAPSLAEKSLRLGEFIKNNSKRFLKKFIEAETEIYKEGEYVLYSAHNFHITVFTDTTERAPTFSLSPFRHKSGAQYTNQSPSLCYVSLPSAKDAKEAWEILLGRAPRALNWDAIDPRSTMSYLSEFDFSAQALKFRLELTQGVPHEIFSISGRGPDSQDEIVWSFCDAEEGLLVKDFTSSLEVHLILKMLMNIHSTLVMGRMGRYQSNMMTWVNPTNGKLIDRACRYVREILKDQGRDISYEEAIYAIFKEMENPYSNKSLVESVVQSLR